MVENPTNQEFSVDFRQCEIGETMKFMTEKIYTCVPCPFGFYSLVIPDYLSKCKSCPSD